MDASHFHFLSIKDIVLKTNERLGITPHLSVSSKGTGLVTFVNLDDMDDICVNIMRQINDSRLVLCNTCLLDAMCAVIQSLENDNHLDKAKQIENEVVNYRWLSFHYLGARNFSLEDLRFKASMLTTMLRKYKEESEL